MYIVCWGSWVQCLASILGTRVYEYSQPPCLQIPRIYKPLTDSSDLSMLHYRGMYTRLTAVKRQYTMKYYILDFAIFYEKVLPDISIFLLSKSYT